jgi:hypothetical protein
MHTTTIHQACAADGCCVLSEGTMDPRVVLPKLLAALEQLAPAAHQQLMQQGGLSSIPTYAFADTTHDWWSSATSDAVLLGVYGSLIAREPEGFVFDVRDDDRIGYFSSKPREEG